MRSEVGSCNGNEKTVRLMVDTCPPMQEKQEPGRVWVWERDRKREATVTVVTWMSRTPNNLEDGRNEWRRVMQRAGNANTSSWNTRKTKWHDCRAITIEMSLCVRVIIVTSRTLVQLPSLLALDAPNMTRVIQMGPVGMGTALTHRGAVRIAIEGFARPLHMALRIENEK